MEIEAVPRKIWAQCRVYVYCGATAHLSSIVDGELRAEHVGPQFSDEWVSTCNKDTSAPAQPQQLYSIH